MTFDANEQTEVRCPLGFTVKPVRPQAHECGHDKCLPSTCERLRRMGIEIHCPHWDDGK